MIEPQLSSMPSTRAGLPDAAAEAVSIGRPLSLTALRTASSMVSVLPASEPVVVSRACPSRTCTSWAPRT